MIASSDKIGGRVRVPAFRLHNCQGQQQQDDKLSHIAAIPDDCGSATSVKAQRASNPRLCIEAAEVKHKRARQRLPYSDGDRRGDKCGALKTCRRFLGRHI
jgi:hypothetical protein